MNERILLATSSDKRFNIFSNLIDVDMVRVAPQFNEDIIKEPNIDFIPLSYVFAVADGKNKALRRSLERQGKLNGDGILTGDTIQVILPNGEASLNDSCHILNKPRNLLEVINNLPYQSKKSVAIISCLVFWRNGKQVDVTTATFVNTAILTQASYLNWLKMNSENVSAALNTCGGVPLIEGKETLYDPYAPIITKLYDKNGAATVFSKPLLHAVSRNDLQRCIYGAFPESIAALRQQIR